MDMTRREFVRSGMTTPVVALLGRGSQPTSTQAAQNLDKVFTQAELERIKGKSIKLTYEQNCGDSLCSICLRDSITNKPIKDFDIWTSTVSDLDQEIGKIVSDIKLAEPKSVSVRLDHQTPKSDYDKAAEAALVKCARLCFPAHQSNPKTAAGRRGDLVQILHRDKQ